MAPWKESIGALFGQKLLINTTSKQLSAKIAVLHNWRQVQKFNNCSFSFSFVVTAPLSLKTLVSLFEDLISQVTFLSSFSVLNYLDLQQALAQCASGAEPPEGKDRVAQVCCLGMLLAMPVEGLEPGGGLSGGAVCQYT